MNKFIITDIPTEWRTSVESIYEPERSFPKNIIDMNNFNEKLSTFIDEDLKNEDNNIIVDKTEKMINIAKILKKQIKNCRLTIQSIEEKRSMIASSAELIHGECDSHLSAEQRLNIFVKSIDSLLYYYDNLDKLFLDFKSPLFNVISPDFPDNLHKIEEGIRFFEMNTHFKDSRVYLLKYQSLQIKAMDLIRDHISLTFSRIIQRIKLNKKIDEQFKNDIYIKFRPSSHIVSKLFKLCEKTSVFADVLSVYKNARIDLLNPILSVSIASIDDIRPRASTSITFAFKEFDLAQSYFQFDSHPLYVRCFSDLISSIGQFFYDSCCGTLLHCNDIKQLCDVCIVLKGDVLQEEISRIPYGAEKLRSHFFNLLSDTQERLLFRTELFLKEIISSPETASQKTIEILSMLYYALPSESFSETACNMITTCISILSESAKKFKDNNIDSDAYRLSHFLILRDQLSQFDLNLIGTSQTIDFEPVSEFLWRLIRFDTSIYSLKGEKGLLKSVAGLSRVISTSIDAKKQLESVTSLAFKSLTSSATQILVQPLLNLEARHGKEKNQILSAIEGINTIILEHYNTQIALKIKNHILNDLHLSAVLEVLKEQLLNVVKECYKSFNDVDEETLIKMNELLELIKNLRF